VNDGFVFHRSIGSASLTVEDTEGNRIWQIPLNDPFSMKLVFTKELILVRTLQGAGPYGQLYVLDRQTGSILWKTERGSILSNATVSNDIVYYLSVDGQLDAADINTGQILGTIDFTPEIIIPNGVYRYHSVAADNGHVVVYLGDSQQLFAFNFLPLSD
jgi:outer membrane protein assembly factor BamB